MASSTSKREIPSEEIEPAGGKRVKLATAEPLETSHAAPVSRVVLNPADCDLDFDIGGDGLRGSSLYEDGFAYCWSGARANVGINRGKFCFGCKVIADQPVVMEDTPTDQQNVCRIGISRGDDAVGNLGETQHSFGFGGTGKFSNAGVFSGYGESFTVGDTVVCCVDLESKPMASIGFFKNGRWLGVAKSFDAGLSRLGLVGSSMNNLPWIHAFYPHILLKNMVVQLQFSTADGLILPEGYKPWASCISDGKMVLGPTFPDSNDCEVIMLVGLPASGKSTWAEKWVTEHPEKRYIVLGTNLALDQMKVPGLLRKKNYGERFDRLMDRATGIFNTLMSRASKLSRNFIIDQTNVYKSARKRKLKPFMYFHKIAVVVFPRPEELKSRSDRRFKEMGKEVPAEAVNEMLANFALPMSKDMRFTDEYFDEVWFPELSRAESQRCLDEMKASVRLENVPSPMPITHSENHGNLPVISSAARPPLVGPPVCYNQSGNSPYGFAYSSQFPGAPPSQNVLRPFEYPVDNQYTPNHGSTGDFHQGYGVGNTILPDSIRNSGVLPLHGSVYCSSRMDEHNPRWPAYPYSSTGSYETQTPSATPYPFGARPHTPLPTGPALYGQHPMPHTPMPNPMPTGPVSYGFPFGNPLPRPPY